MRMTKLQIDRPTYGPNRNEFVGRIFFEDNHSAAIEIPLNDELSRRVLEVCAEQVIAAGKAAAEMMVADVIEATTGAKLIEGGEAEV